MDVSSSDDFMTLLVNNNFINGIFETTHLIYVIENVKNIKNGIIEALCHAKFLENNHFTKL